ncbi:MAG: ribonuclease Z [Flavobacterium sp.]|nr:ribonuclease Z [Flavobacterium sp.]
MIKDTQGDLKKFLDNVTHEYKSFEKNNLIIDLLSYDNLKEADITAFRDLSDHHRNANKSFIIVADTDFNSISEQFVVVPTILEAHDMIEMDEIQRDLGF